MKVFLPPVRPNGKQGVEAHCHKTEVSITHVQTRPTPNELQLIDLSQIKRGVGKMHPDIDKFRGYIFGWKDSTGDVEVVVEGWLRRG